MNDILFMPLQLNELETLIEKSFERVLLKIKNTQQPQSSETESDIIFVNDVCKLTDLKKQTIYGLIHKRKIPFIKPDGTKKVMFSRVAVIEWLQTDRTSK